MEIRMYSRGGKLERRLGFPNIRQSIDFPDICQRALYCSRFAIIIL